MKELIGDDGYVFVLTNEKDYDKARLLAKSLLERKLAACINFSEVKSMYRWEGRIEESNEVQLLIKTSKSRLKNLFLEIKSLHSYQIPELILWDLYASKEYGNWIRKSVEI